VPDVLEPVGSRLRLVVLVHLPLSDETASRRRRPSLRASSAGVARRRRDRSRPAPARPGDCRPARPAAGSGARAAPVWTGAARGRNPAGRAAALRRRVIPRKGQDVLLDALATVADLAWSCVCVGALDRAPDFAAALAERATDLRSGGPPASAAVSAVSARTGAELAPYAAPTCSCCRRGPRPYGMVVTEALARGIPCSPPAWRRARGARRGAGRPRPGRAGAAGRPGALAGRDPALADRRRVRGRCGLRPRPPGHLRGWDETIRTVSEVLSA
jgi:hypothetical protein